MTKSCTFCSKSYVKLSNHSRKRWSASKFCSIRCATDSRINDPARLAAIREKRWSHVIRRSTCLHCGIAKRCKQFCSRTCAGLYKRKASTAENRRLRDSPQAKAWRFAVYKRDKFTCQHCQAVGKYLNADHIKPWSQYPDLRFDLSNGRTLCVDCHRKTPTFGFAAMWAARKAVA